MCPTLRNFDALLVSCEHASNKLPAAFKQQLGCPERILRTHQAYDIGARQMASYISRRFAAPYFAGQYSRLLIDLNRSLHHHHLFSRFSSRLPGSLKQQLIDRFYTPYRTCVEDSIRQRVQKNHTVLHLSFHSFTPVLHGESRDCDIGLLYDPKRPLETVIAKALQRALSFHLPDHVIRRNFPYRGTADGFTVYLRRHFRDGQYAGIEVEINQRCIDNTRPIQRALAVSIQQVQEHPSPV